MGQSPNSINYTDNSDDTVLIQGNADLNNGIVVPRIWSSQITKKSYPNDIIFTVRALVGEIARNSYFATIGRGVASFKGNDFLYQSLIQKKENNYWNKYKSDIKNSEDNPNKLREEIDNYHGLIDFDNKKHFSNILELGKQYVENIKKYGYPQWYDWCVENWGTKWNVKMM